MKEDPLVLNIIGVMSGTSLDGVDLAHCTFDYSGEAVSHRLNACITIPYTEEWSKKLSTLHASGAMEYASTHVAYGRLLGQMVHEFMEQVSLPVDFVSSHGHTIFHQPGSGFTSQIGEGAALAAECGIPVICDFRTGDVAHGGQGAPLVPIGDDLLFNEFAYCLNLGGFANISTREDHRRIAYDICPVNIVLNHFARLRGISFDRDGMLASTGRLNEELLERLNQIAYYNMPPPKSLGREWVETEVLPLVTSHYNPEDILRTFTEHIAIQIGKGVIAGIRGEVLVTGGGAFNAFLVERIRNHCVLPLHIPDRNTVEFKEALIFAFLGMLRVYGKPNCLSSVTGANKDTCGGTIYLP